MENGKKYTDCERKQTVKNIDRGKNGDSEKRQWKKSVSKELRIIGTQYIVEKNSGKIYSGEKRTQ